MACYSYPLWSIWMYLPILHRLFFVILAGTVIYDFVSAGLVESG